MLRLNRFRLTLFGFILLIFVANYYLQKEVDGAVSADKETRKVGCNNEEILAVLAHELGHWKLNHNLKNLIIGQVSIIEDLHRLQIVLNLSYVLQVKLGMVPDSVSIFCFIFCIDGILKEREFVLHNALLHLAFCLVM